MKPILSSCSSPATEADLPMPTDSAMPHAHLAGAHALLEHPEGPAGQGSDAAPHGNAAQPAQAHGHPHHRLPMGGRFLMPHKRDFGDSNRFFAREGGNPLADAFEGKLTVHPGMGGLPVAGERRASLLESLSRKPAMGPRLAYIHVPFCEIHCLYCSFYQNKYRREAGAEYTEALIRELQLWSDREAQNGAPVHALYLGGGTPTALEPEDLARVLRAAATYLPLANDCEITLEGRVADLTAPRIEAALAHGVNRFSLGVQSFNTDVRRAMGRRADQETLLKNIHLLQTYNQAAVVVDLIYGMPNQTMAVWEDDLRVARSLDLDGLDCYQLGVHTASPLATAIANGRIAPAADVAMQSRMFAMSSEFFEDSLFRRLSISHWGRTPRERNLYNLYTKTGVDCLAFGPGAGGSLHGHMTYNSRDYAAWLAQVTAGQKPLAMLMEPAPRFRLDKALVSGLEQGVLDWQRIDSLCEEQPLGDSNGGKSLRGMLLPLLSQWQRAGLCECTGRHCTLSLAGQFWYVNLTQLLLEYLDEQLRQAA